MSESLAFYCVADARYFLGAVGMINSLRLQGHRERVYVLDCGLEPGQRALLEPAVELVEAPLSAAPHLLKTVAPLAHPAEAMVLIDADMLITRPLDPLIGAARAGRLTAFANNEDRWVAEWGELLGLGAVRRLRYLCSGFVAAPRELAIEVLSLMAELRERVDFSETYWRRGISDYPFLYADQDLLNAVLGARVEPSRIEVHPYRLAAPTPFGGLEARDLEPMRCAYPDGVEPYLVHHILPSKPWLRPTYHGVFSQLLMRALLGTDVEIRVPPDAIPLWLRAGRRAGLERRRIHVRDRLGWFARDHLPRSLTERLDAWRAAAARSR